MNTSARSANASPKCSQQSETAMANKRRKGGRPRKTGARYRNGHLKAVMAESPRERAAHMPHRRALGESAVDPAAESELGRMRLRGEVSEPEATAGEVYARMWRGYVSTLNAPATPGEAQGRVSACAGCPWPEDRKYCLCDLRRRIYVEATGVLVSTGRGIAPVVRWVAIMDQKCAPSDLVALKLGLTALAWHYGLLRQLTNQRKRSYQNARSPKTVAPTNS
jgi:hypothetical protein